MDGWWRLIFNAPFFLFLLGGLFVHAFFNVQKYCHCKFVVELHSSNWSNRVNGRVVKAFLPNAGRMLLCSANRDPSGVFGFALYDPPRAS